MKNFQSVLQKAQCRNTSLLNHPLSIPWEINLVAVIYTLIFATTCTYICWWYWKLNRAYAKFPSVRLEVKYTLKILLGRYPKNVPFTSVIFNEAVRIAKQFEKEGFFVLWFYKPILIIFNKDILKRLYSEPAVVNKSSLYDLSKDMLGNGLLISKDEVWKSHRKLLNPAFHTRALKGKIDVFNEHAAELVTELEKVACKRKFDVFESIKECSFSVLTESILGLKLKNEKYRTKVVNYFKNLEKFDADVISRGAGPWLHWKFSSSLFSSGRKYLKLCDDIQNFTKEILEEIKNSNVVSNNSQEDLDLGIKNEKSLSHILLEQHLKDPTFTIQDVRDQLTNFISTGHDTVSYTLMWCLYCLGLHSEVQEKAFQETAAVKGDVTYNDLCEMKYLSCVINETLRMYSTVPLYARKLNKEVQWEEYTIPNGTDVAFFIYMLHRSPYIYPNPEKFDPERFSENFDIRPWTHMPFAEGYRNCIGKKFALMETKVILTHIIRRFKIETLEKIDDTSELDWIIVLKPVKPFRLLFTLR